MIRVWTKGLVLCLMGAGLLLAGGCGDDDGGPGPVKIQNRLALQFWNTPSLPGSWRYQLWAFTDSAWHVGPAFELNIDSQGNLRDTLEFTSLDLTLIDSLRITIQQNVAADTSTAELVFLTTTFHLNDFFTLESPLMETTPASGLTFILATATDTDTSFVNRQSGVWFTGRDTNSVGLQQLPELPDGWIFEGWAFHGGYHLSTGKFAGSEGRDSSCTYYNCQAAAPDYPGEDFLTNPPGTLSFPFLFVVGDTIMLTIEPAVDFAEDAPFIQWHFRHFPPGSVIQPAGLYSIPATSSPNWPVVNASVPSD